MTDRLEVLVSETLDELARKTHVDEAFLARLIEAMGPAQRQHRPQRRVWAAVSTAAAIVGVALLIALVVRPAFRNRVPPSHSNHTTPVLATPTRTTALPTDAVVQRCVVQTPDAWVDKQIQVGAPGAGVQGSTAGLTVLAMTSTGDAITYSDVGHGALVLVQPDGATHVLYSVSQTQSGQRLTTIQTAQTDGQWVAFDLVDTTQHRVQILAVNLNSRAVREVAAAGSSIGLSAPQLLHGTVYWGETTFSESDAIRGYNLATMHRATIDTGQVLNPRVVGGALLWARGDSPQWLGTPHLPADYPISPKAVQLVQTGNSAAWSDWDQNPSLPLPTVMVQTAGSATPQAAFRGTQAPADIGRQPAPFALIGNYLVYSDGTDLLALDLRTRAAIQLSEYIPGIIGAAASDGILAIDTFGSKGGGHLALLRPADLPEPHC